MRTLIGAIYAYPHLSNNCGGWNKRIGVQKLQNQMDFFCQFLSLDQIGFSELLGLAHRRFCQKLNEPICFVFLFFCFTVLEILET